MKLLEKSTSEIRVEKRWYEVFRILIVALSSFMFLWFIFVLPYDLKNIGKIFGAFMCVCAFSFFTFRRFFLRLKTRLYEKKLSRILWKTVKILIYSFMVYAVIISSVILGCMAISPAGNATVIVLGAQVRPWGPSAILQERIDAAADYLKKNPDSVCVASGGQGEDEPYSEAKAIADSLIQHGIDSDRIIIEDNSTSTLENFIFSLEKLEENNKDSKNLAIATDGFHQARVRLIASKLGVSANIGAVNAETNPLYFPSYFVREWFALPFEFLFR